MRKAFLSSFILLCGNFYVFSQLIEGDLLTDNRKITHDIQYIFSKSNYDGKLFFAIAVDEYGKISSAKVIDNRSTIHSTPARINATKLIYNIKFEPGAKFPKHHSGVYQLIYKRN